VPRDLPGDARVKLYFYLPPGDPGLFIDDLKLEFMTLKDEKQYRKIEGAI
jgi:hypothetical protein